MNAVLGSHSCLCLKSCGLHCSPLPSLGSLETSHLLSSSLFQGLVLMLSLQLGLLLLLSQLLGLLLSQLLSLLLGLLLNQRSLLQM